MDIGRVGGNLGDDLKGCLEIFMVWWCVDDNNGFILGNFML